MGRGDVQWKQTSIDRGRVAVVFSFGLLLFFNFYPTSITNEMFQEIYSPTCSFYESKCIVHYPELEYASKAFIHVVLLLDRLHTGNVSSVRGVTF